MMLTRAQFIQYFNNLQAGLGDQTSPLWVGEKYLVEKQCNWFINVRPINVNDIHNHNFRKWVKTYCKGQVLCYSSNTDDQEEWWGFTNKDDILLWMLRWT